MRLSSAVFRGLAVIAAVTVGTTAVAQNRGIPPQKNTLEKLMRPITIEFSDQRLEDVFNFINDVSGAEVEFLMIDDRTGLGFDPDETITMSVKNSTMLALIERVSDRVGRDLDASEGYTWQLTEYGAIEVGPRELLNRHRRVELYDIRDLLIEVPDYTNAPEFDLQQVLQAASQGGQGGGQSPFQDQQDDIERVPLQDRIEELTDIITGLVETEQWVRNGGEAATIRYFQGNYLINAPDYVHRGINGYRFWPSRQTIASRRDGRRYVTVGPSIYTGMTRIAPTTKTGGP